LHSTATIVCQEAKTLVDDEREEGKKKDDDDDHDNDDDDEDVDEENDGNIVHSRMGTVRCSTYHPTIKEKVFISGVRGKCDERALVIEITLSKSAPTTFLLFFFVFYLLPTKPSRNIE
jgi:hypothetical protein